MKNWFITVSILLLCSCQSQKKFMDYELSYSRSGGLSPVYENLLIKGNSAIFFFEGRGKKYKNTATISGAEKANLINAIADNHLKYIQEDNKKVYDHITTTVKIKNGDIIKSDGSLIRAEYQQNWSHILSAFESFITSKNLRNTK